MQCFFITFGQSTLNIQTITKKNLCRSTVAQTWVFNQIIFTSEKTHGCQQLTHSNICEDPTIWQTTCGKADRLWQCQLEINKVKSKKTKSEPIATHSTIQSEPIAYRSTNQIKQVKSSATFKFVVASVFNNILIDSWQCQMEINNVKSQLIDSWQPHINKVDLKLLSLCSIHHSCQSRSDFDITLIFIDQSSSTFLLVVASSNNNTLSFDDSVDRSSDTFKLVVVSITIKYSTGSFKVSSGAFQ